MVKVELNQLVREFPDDIQIGPIDLVIEDGELMTLLGPSGSGKTTALRMIAGFIDVDQGSVLFNRMDVTNVPTRERKIGMVFQSIALFPNMTVYQNIAFGPEMAGWSRERTIQRVEELADLLGIRHLLMRRISEISGGEGQRVALARALAKKPDMLLLDEPLSALDPQLRERLQAEIRRIQKQLGITTLYVTHSQEEAFAISDRVAILESGRIVQVGTPEELYDRPKSKFVAEFLGSGNVFEGTVVGHDGQVSLIDIGDVILRVEGLYEEGNIIAFSVKPEDVAIADTPSDGYIQGEVASITPQLGSFKVGLQFSGHHITVLTYDEELVRELRASATRKVSFFFEPNVAFVFNG